MPRASRKRIHLVSIPFIAGQWSLAEAEAWAQKAESDGFNPLHCGAVVARGGAGDTGAASFTVSIPFIAGQWSLDTP